MKHASLFLVGALLLAACEGVPDVSGDLLSQSGADTAKKKDAADAATSAPLKSPTSGGVAATTTSAPLVDAGAPAPALDAFTGATAFAELTPLVDSSDQHDGTSNAGRDCLSCHGEANGAPQFALGGTVRALAGQPDGATGMQVRIVGPDGKEIALVGTDSVGNFWMKGAATIPAGSHVGIRDGATEKKMSGTIGAGSCNTSGCHDTTRPIFLGAN